MQNCNVPTWAMHGAEKPKLCSSCPLICKKCQTGRSGRKSCHVFWVSLPRLPPAHEELTKATYSIPSFLQRASRNKLISQSRKSREVQRWVDGWQGQVQHVGFKRSFLGERWCGRASSHSVKHVRPAHTGMTRLSLLQLTSPRSSASEMECY